MTQRVDDDRAAASRQFLQRLEARFAGWDDPLREPLVWVGGRLIEDHRVVIVYRERRQGPLLGRIYDVTELGAGFIPSPTIEGLADIVFADEFADPTGHGTTLDVDWAQGLTEAPGDVEWVVPWAERQM